MMQTNWQKTVSGIITAIWIYTLAGIAGSIVSFVDGLMSPLDLMDLIESLSGGGDDFEPSGLDVLGWLFDAVVIGGYIYFYSSISAFVGLQRSENDRLGADKVKSSYILMIIAIILAAIPVISIIGFILMIVAYAKQIKGYRVLSESALYNENAKQGATLLRKSTGWILASIFIGWIPLVGGILEGIILLITFFQILKGWRLVSLNDVSGDVQQPSNENSQSQSSADMIEKYADALAVKSDDELREIALHANSYDAAFVALAKEELMERTLGNRVRRSQEDIKREQAERERIRQQEAAERERLQKEEEERLQKEKEERARETEIFIRKAMWVISILIVLILIGVFIHKRNTPEGLVNRSLSAYENGKTEKAVKLAKRAYNKSHAVYDSYGEIDALEALYFIYNNEGDEVQKVEYMRTLADMDVSYYSIIYGLYLAEQDYSNKELYIPYLKSGIDGNYDCMDSMEECGKAAYMVGNYLYDKGEISEAKAYWQTASGLSYSLADVRLGDYILCHERRERHLYEKALNYYKIANQNIPGVKERVEILSSIVATNPQDWYYNGNTQGYYESSGKIVWGYMVFTNGNHMYGQFERQKGNWGYDNMNGLPHFKGISCNKMKNGSYYIRVGGQARQGNFYNSDGDVIAMYPNGDITVGELDFGTWKKTKHSYNDWDVWE